eukprot:3110208-Ditylum_brightwellii.AAC.1
MWKSSNGLLHSDIKVLLEFSTLSNVIFEAEAEFDRAEKWMVRPDAMPVTSIQQAIYKLATNDDVHNITANARMKKMKS